MPTVSNPRVNHLSITEISIINAVKSNLKTLDEISEKTGIRKEPCDEILKRLVSEKVLTFVNDEYGLPDNGKHIKLRGNFNLPISVFTDANGKRWVVRGTCHELPDGIELDQIDWIDDSDEESELQRIMRGVKEQQLKEKKKVLPNIADEDGEASSDDIKFLGAWRNVNDKWKIYPCEISAKRCIIEISPRFVSSNNIEFPYGACSPKKIITIEVLRELLVNHDATNLPEYNIDEAIAYIPNSFPVCEYIKDNEVVGFEYLSTKKSSTGMKIVHYGMQIGDKNKFTTIDTIDVSKSDATDYIKKIAKLSIEKSN